jgi:hypothetical protein
MVFGFALKSGWLRENPFVGLRYGGKENPSRQVYVDHEKIHKVMQQCRDDHDRLVLAMARFAGLRIASEIKKMCFGDIVGNEFRVHEDTKTGMRTVPLFREVRVILERVIAERKAQGTYSDDALIFNQLGGFRSRILRVIESSGVKRWEKLFINLRSSCITDIAERGYHETVLDAIFGNSAFIRKRHYIQFRKDRAYAKVLEDDERLADGDGEKVKCQD